MASNEEQEVSEDNILMSAFKTTKANKPPALLKVNL
jgi:hypothetical protein